jgi:hypothetical protein
VKSNGRIRAGEGGSPARRLTSVVVVGVLAVIALVLMRCESTGGAPTDIKLTAATDTTVTVSWTAPAGGAPEGYVVAFMETGTSAWVDFGNVTDSATTTGHNPLGKTGKYRVTAVFGASTFAAAETPTSAPVHTEGTLVSELNEAGLPGYGWARDSGEGATFPMMYASKADKIDFYITDWATGHAGPTYAIASPDWGPNEPGGAGVVPPGAWRATAFSPALASEQAPLPAFSSGTYGNNVELAADSTIVAVYTDTLGSFRHYALVKLSSPDTSNGTVRVETWFQLIKGLRLIQH